jgi:hypothetical protein
MGTDRPVATLLRRAGSRFNLVYQRGVGGRVNPGRDFVSLAANVVGGTHSINLYKGKKSRAAERPDAINRVFRHAPGAQRKPGGLSLICLTAEVYGHR